MLTPTMFSFPKKTLYIAYIIMGLGLWAEMGRDSVSLPVHREMTSLNSNLKHTAT
ncbi:hypothetical protein Hanom_Chr01g00058701 [Helianthus anomalus]